MTLVPGERIKVIFNNQPLDHLQPTSQTCFKILHIPRGYQSFTHLKSNLTKYICSQELLGNTGYWRYGVKVLFAAGIKFQHFISFGFTFNLELVLLLFV